jgi:uroporphyrinogen-III decarboxylase
MFAACAPDPSLTTSRSSSGRAGDHVSRCSEPPRRRLSAAKPGGAYIMSTSDEVPYDARLENLKAIVEAVAAEGVY